jgi:hypothetical protein
MRASRLGKMPTTSVRLRISRLSRSGLFDQIWRQSSSGNAVKGEKVGAGAVEVLGGHCEVFITIGGKTHYLWREVDQHGQCPGHSWSPPDATSDRDQVLSQAAHGPGVRAPGALVTDI